ncbi:hypothetical protein [Methylibium petroleiphilum]|uniref:hypothetical protein n=1 Tax=Methylibium petroleiphilum TaxID=105560 RepID=UPI00003CD1A0|nr:hypothetical protein [Methylibium petroleiphilum]
MLDELLDHAPPAGDSLSDPDWSRGDWEATCLTRLVRQRSSHDCGVACLAMAAGTAYEDALQTFRALGLDGKPKPLSSNFTDLGRALRAHGMSCRLKRWAGWEAFTGLGVIKVGKRDGRQRDWHWVVAEAHPEFGLVVRDPGSPLVALRNPPLSVCYRDIDRIDPYGSWLSVARAAGAAASHLASA